MGGSRNRARGCSQHRSGATRLRPRRRRAVLVLCPGERVVSEQVAQGLGVYSPMLQSGVEAAPSATMRRLEAEVDWRSDSLGAEESVGELEEGISPAVETLVE